MVTYSAQMKAAGKATIYPTSQAKNLKVTWNFELCFTFFTYKVLPGAVANEYEEKKF